MLTTSLSGLRVAVAGAGVFGLSIAAAAARAGAQVTVFDLAPIGDNASGVAAGMLSPALETALEGGDATRFALFTRAYAAWPAFADGLRLPRIEREAGAIRIGDPATLASLADRLAAIGAFVTALAAAEVRALQPLYKGDQDGLFVADDARLDPPAMLAALAARLADDGGRIVHRRIDAVATPDGFDRLVVATGHQARAWAPAASALANLVPIKGHILRFAMPARGGATLRSTNGYLVPQLDAIAFGASMEPGRADPAVDAAVAQELRRHAIHLAPALADVRWTARAGVRAATQDGLPLVGAIGGGVILATGARRNGWLIAPLVVQATLEALKGGEPWSTLSPTRFNPG